MNRYALLLTAWLVSLTMLGCEKEPAAPAPAPAPTPPPAGKAIDGSEDVATLQGKPLDGSADASSTQSQPPADTTAADAPVTQKDAPTDPPATPAPTPDTPDPAAAQPANPNHLANQNLKAPVPVAVEGYTPVNFDIMAGFIYIIDDPTLPEGEPGEPGDTSSAAPQNFELKPAPEGFTPREDPTIAARKDPNRKKGDDQIPADVKALSGQKISIAGYMIPIDFRKGGTNEFILVKIVPSCFFCQQPMPNEWIEVKVKDGRRVPYSGDNPITVTGVIDIGSRYEDDIFLSLYRMEADDVKEMPVP